MVRPLGRSQSTSVSCTGLFVNAERPSVTHHQEIGGESKEQK